MVAVPIFEQPDVLGALRVSLPDRPLARATDPVTSKGRLKFNKYEKAVLYELGLGFGGMTGKEIAAHSENPLNCITPRFAPLRRKGLIKDSGQRRDKQIVWVLV
jgi:hypothetical protein